MGTAIVWFRRDLRLEDHPALDAAAAAHERVLPLYVHAPEEEAPWAPGAASRWWLHRSLAALDGALRERGGALHLRRGPSVQALLAVASAANAEAVYWHRLYEPAARVRDAEVEASLRAVGIVTHAHNGALLFEPWEVATGKGEPYRVFTPFWRGARVRLRPAAPSPAAPPRRWATLAGGLPLHAFGLLPRIAWDDGLRAAWRPGEAGAREALRTFCEGALSAYAGQRDRPDRRGTSRLSPHLHFGELSPRQVVRALEDGARRHGRARLGEAVEAYLREIGWREFAHHLLYHFPQTPEANLDASFDAFAWAEPDAETLARWQRGRTGVPIVDAGMRELWTTGWMHNRVRMIVASFLTKNLRLHWRHGARWFWDTLVDADLANNTQGWQWSAGTGADAAPYFRIFNPVAQARKFDPEGAYVRRWIPELAEAPPELLHEPWRDAALLARSGYPPPMVDLKTSRVAALAAWQRMRGR
ncbi:deoxyribodipyrimidine photo lyase [Mizugakiibacter sediminis]|uniref:Deoxyribodipyrimidine photo-lyase n=1 Tax=Mizugakiibacter sediminis TaxID=1475481 RepID=A0A0K8QSB9_9GAMM|nr:deoxyribodipyrimidine photo-lyase [Mizugakiibacter sediminis]GAP67297.1 deoxyribodipyrimidine photo lyase [Mizugakiibacter sediminis]